MFQVHIANFITAEQNVQFGLRCLQYFACCFWVIGRKFISRGKAGRFYYLPLNLLVNGRVKFFRFAFICVYILGSLLLFGKQLQFSLTFFYLIFQVIYSISGRYLLFFIELCANSFVLWFSRTYSCFQCSDYNINWQNKKVSITLLRSPKQSKLKGH